jgi:hypothetical protein
MSSKTSWSIIDRDGRAIGSWIGGFYHVYCYDRYSEAKQDALALSVPDFRILRSEEVIRREPSQITR